MDNSFQLDQVIENQTFSGNMLAKEYEACEFNYCNFEGIDLVSIQFINCSFMGCNLTNCKVKNTAFKEVSFTDCKILGVNFSVCNPFLLELVFTRCTLDLCSFYKLKLKGIVINNCSLKNVDFVEANLQDAVFENCDFYGSAFERTNLERADLTTSRNFSLDPELNIIKKAKFSANGALGLLRKYDIVVSM